LFVFFLFFKCWILGGFVYWFFLSNIMFFFVFYDLFIGILIFCLGLFMYFFLKFLYSIFFSLGGIFSLRWIATSGISYFFGNIFYINYESTWMERLGGTGLYKILMDTSKIFTIFSKVSLGGVIFVFIYLGIYYFYF
jgi:hypothetical protein